MEYHPDRKRSRGAEERFKGYRAEAYASLSDPKKPRRNTDARALPASRASARRTCSAASTSKISSADQLDFWRQQPLRGILPPPAAPGRARRKYRVELSVPLERVYSGGEEQVHLRRPATCTACHGTGAEGGPRRAPARPAAAAGASPAVGRRKKRHVLIQQISTCPLATDAAASSTTPANKFAAAGESKRTKR